MAARKRFDPDDALDEAVGLFWAKGYEATSAQDLVDAMGINRGSLYATFGGKRDLYIRALERYLARDRAKLSDALDQEGPLRDVLATLFARYAEQLSADPQRRGCFMANACADLTPDDDDVAAVLTEELRAQEAIVARAIRAARRRGEPVADSPNADLAAYLVSMLLGARVTARTTGDRRHLNRVLTIALGAVFTEE